MRMAATTFWRCLGSAMLLLSLAFSPAFANEIKGLSVDTGPTGTRAEILLDASADYSLLSLAGPDRLVVDLPGVVLPANLSLPTGQGVVRAVRTGHPVPGKTRVVFDLAAPVAVLQPRLEAAGGGQRLVLEWPGDGAPARDTPALSRDEAALAAAILNGQAERATAASPAVDPAAASADATSRLIAQMHGVRDAPPATATVQVPTTVATGVPAPAPVQQPVAPAPPQPAPLPQQPMRPLIIAIDAGHGGQDPGAIGKGGSREKDVTLAISRELARQINATPGLRAYLTRDTDVFIPLYKRARLARQAHADIFISIHADAAENRSADGSSVYVLSLKGASSQRARWLADKENAADLIGGVRVAQASNTLNAVLLDLTQSGNMKASEDAASQVLAGLQRVGNIHKRDIEHANFAVLRTADMPSMLVETAFISNPAEEQRLRDPAFQRKVAGAVLDGISTYFERQPPPGTLYALRAANELYVFENALNPFRFPSLRQMEGEVVESDIEGRVVISAGASPAEAASPHVRSRLYPRVPEGMRYVSFYPMSKRRQHGDNWYTLPIDERSSLMRDHGLTGRRYAGKVFQVITGSVGFEEWEWGVTLFAREPLDFKRLVTDMRFDEVSARYGEFGRFFTGIRMEGDGWRSLLAAD